mgnify:CR=1 FL=1
MCLKCRYSCEVEAALLLLRSCSSALHPAAYQVCHSLYISSLHLRYGVSYPKELRRSCRRACSPCDGTTIKNLSIRCPRPIYGKRKKALYLFGLLLRLRRVPLGLGSAAAAAPCSPQHVRCVLRCSPFFSLPIAMVTNAL